MSVHVIRVVWRICNDELARCAKAREEVFGRRLSDGVGEAAVWLLMLLIQVPGQMVKE